jgi:DNA invertase Pin-like site-specific DNA recombinase
MVHAGMERARHRGKRLGRPKGPDRPEFAQRFVDAIELTGLGELSLAQAAKHLDIGYATLKRLQDGNNLPIIASDTGGNEYAEVV